MLDEDGKRAHGLDHPRSGELVAIARADRWFTYYYWLDDARAPDFARTVDIHRKPGYDPVELFLDPGDPLPEAQGRRRLAKRKLLDLRALIDVIPLDASLVKGSHGRLTDDPAQGPVFISGDPTLVPDGRGRGDRREGAAAPAAVRSGRLAGARDGACPLRRRARAARRPSPRGSAKSAHAPIALGDALLPYLRLVRAPAVFSALGDPLAGLLLDGERIEPARAARLSAASALIYLAGMALNDLADREEDARERPDRPIPSGAVSPRAAAIVGGSLLLAGTLAAWRGGARWTGPRARRCRRRLRFPAQALGHARPHRDGRLPVALAADGRRSGRAATVDRRGAEGALLLGAYVAGLTLVARGETGAARTTELRTGAALAAGALLATAIRGGPSSLPWAAATGALAGPALSRALREPGPKTVGPAVGALIRAIPALDGAIAGTRAPRPAMVLVSLLALTRWGRTLIPIT